MAVLFAFFGCSGIFPAHLYKDEKEQRTAQHRHYAALLKTAGNSVRFIFL